VSNADHAQVVITYQDGRQALFINSDLAAARKPKYLLLGTKGSLIGNWDQAATTPADLPAIICLHKADGSQQILTPVVAAPHAFHTAVAKHLLQGEKMPIDTLQSRDVVAIMQAAEKSAAANSVAIKPALLTI
jgi:predicted dehydrogenase